MKRLLLAASLSVVAFAVVSVASASALTGTCAVTGTAKFHPNLSLTSKTHRKYEFEGTATCVKTTGANPETGPVNVAGEFKGECLTGESEPNTSHGELFGKPFTLEFTSAGGVVVLEVSSEGGAKAYGAAEFLSSNEVALTEGQLAAECALGGVETLGFGAVVAGEVNN